VEGVLDRFGEQPARGAGVALSGLLVGLLLAAACSSSGRPVGPPTTASAPVTSTSAPCSPAAVVASWPLARRAAQVLVLPALDANIAALNPTIGQGVGGVLLLGTVVPADVAAQITAANQVAGRALFVMADEEGGGVRRLASRVTTSLPWARDMAATLSPEQVTQRAAAAARQMIALGVNVDLAPVLDLDAAAGPSRTDADGRRSFSLDPAVASTYGLAFAAGLRQGGVVPVVKHFPGLGGATPNTDYGPASTRPLAALRSAGLLPFVAAINAGLPAVMVANAAVPGLTTGPASVSAQAIAVLLRGELHFDGLVLTDSLSAGAISAAGYDLPAATVAAIQAGADMVLFGSTLTPAETALLRPDRVPRSAAAMIDALKRWVTAGGVAAASRLDDAVVHVLTAKGIRLCG
jgi:beta-N-acetylhexosaminidase